MNVAGEGYVEGAYILVGNTWLLSSRIVIAVEWDVNYTAVVMVPRRQSVNILRRVRDLNSCLHI